MEKPSGTPAEQSGQKLDIEDMADLEWAIPAKEPWADVAHHGAAKFRLTRASINSIMTFEMICFAGRSLWAD